MSEHRVAVISDTHDLLRPEAAEVLKGCECILHAGDFSSRKILAELQAIAPVYAVEGNNDYYWAQDLPLKYEFGLYGLRVCMAHRKKDLVADVRDFDLVVTGHTHQYACEWLEGKDGRKTLLLNPGSCGPRRFYQPVTMAVLTIRDDGFDAERIDLANPPAEKKDGGDLRKQIENVIRETGRGMTVEAVAAKYGMAPEKVEQIARLYVTHPGVTVDGIMTKMGL